MTSRTRIPDQPLDRRAIRFRWVVAVAAALVIAASFAYAPFVGHGPVLCPARLVLGIPCPSCGLTRSFCAMSSGEIGDAFGFHLLGPVFYACTALATPLALLEIHRGRRFEYLARVLYSSRVAWLLAGVLVVYHLTRLTLAAHDGTLLASMEHSVCGEIWSSLLEPSAAAR